MLFFFFFNYFCNFYKFEGRHRSLKILIQGEKLRRLPSHPLHTNLAQPTKITSKANAWTTSIKNCPGHTKTLWICHKLLTDSALKPDREADIQMFLSIPGITSKEQLPGEIRNLILALIADRLPHTAWTHLYTDGSAEEGMKNGGSGVYIRYSDGDSTSLSVPGGIQCSNYRAEMLAICTAAEHLLESRKKGEISPSSLTLYQPFKPSTQLIQTRWSKAALLPCQADSSVFSIPPVGACSCGTDRKRTSRQTCKNRQSGSADTEPCHPQRGQHTSPLSVQWRLEERQRWISGTPWPNLETGAGPADHYLPPAHRALWSECPSEEDWHIRHFPLWVWTSWPNPRPHPSALPKICQVTSANMAAGCWSGDQAVGLGRRPLPDGWFCGINRAEDLTCTAVNGWRRRG